MLISSRSNPAIKLIRGLRSRKAREESGLFFIEGIRIVGEAVELGAGIERGVLAPDLLTSPFGRELARRLRDSGVPCIEVTAEVFRSISPREGPPGIGAVVRQRRQSLAEMDPAGSRCWVALDAAQDPGNVGTIVRTCEAVGGSGVILLGAATDPYDPAAVRASMGAIFAQQLATADFGELIAWSQSHGCRLIGTSGAARTDYRAIAYAPPTILLMGSEREGLLAEQQATCDAVVSIPIAGRSDSLNLAVATGVILYEMFNQWRADTL